MMAKQLYISSSSSSSAVAETTVRVAQRFANKCHAKPRRDYYARCTWSHRATSYMSGV
jgi:hypothetical protein